LTDAQWKRLQEQWEARHQGVSKAGRVAILEGGAKWQNMSLNSKQLEFLDGRRMNREEILGALGVPKTIVSLTDDLNYAIAQAHKKIFWSDTILPLLSKFESRVKTDFFDRFLRGQNIVGLFNTENVSELQEDLKEKADIAKSFYEMGVPFNQINERLDLGFEDVPGGDEPKPSGSGPALFEMPEEIIEFKEEPKLVRKGKKLPLNTIEERQATWHTLSGYMLPFKTKFIHKSREIWKEMKVSTLARVEEHWKKRDFTGWSKRKVSEALQKQSLDDMIFEMDAFRREWRSRMRGTIAGAVNESGTRSIEMVSMGRVFDVSDPEIMHWIEQRGMELATSVTATAAEEIRLILVEGYQDGLSVAEMSSTIGSYFDISESYKAERIARTEIAFAQTEGAREAYRQSDVVVSMEWLANPNACEVCSSLDGQEFDKFSDAGPPEHPNCECTLLPITQEEGEE
jgi:SPP1 gp7 family putative phage head morphogenesis protein